MFCEFWVRKDLLRELQPIFVLFMLVTTLKNIDFASKTDFNLYLLLDTVTPIAGTLNEISWNSST